MSTPWESLARTDGTAVCTAHCRNVLQGHACSAILAILVLGNTCSAAVPNPPPGALTKDKLHSMAVVSSPRLHIHCDPPRTLFPSTAILSRACARLRLIPYIVFLPLSSAVLVIIMPQDCPKTEQLRLRACFLLAPLCSCQWPPVLPSGPIR